MDPHLSWDGRVSIWLRISDGREEATQLGDGQRQGEKSAHFRLIRWRERAFRPLCSIKRLATSECHARPGVCQSSFSEKLPRGSACAASESQGANAKPLFQETFFSQIENIECKSIHSLEIEGERSDLRIGKDAVACSKSRQDFQGKVGESVKKLDKNGPTESQISYVSQLAEPIVRD
jgi:hypothetical protein